MTIQEILRDHNVEFAEAGEHHHARSSWLALRDCPFCGSQNYHLGWNLHKGFFSCWKCRGHGIISTLIRVGVPYEQAEAFAKGRDLLPGREEKVRIKLVEPAGRGPLMPIHRKYLQGRGFNPDQLAKLWGLEGIGNGGGSLSWRVYIPIIHRGNRVSFTCRAIGDEVPSRYISASPEQEAINHKDLVYGLDDCQQSIIAVEGPADAWNIGLGAGCLFGTAYSAAQVLLLSKIPYRFVCFDSTPEAQRRANDLAAELAPFPGETTVVELDAEDPGQASKREVRMIRKMAGLD